MDTSLYLAVGIVIFLSLVSGMVYILDWDERQRTLQEKSPMTQQEFADVQHIKELTDIVETLQWNTDKIVARLNLLENKAK